MAYLAGSPAAPDPGAGHLLDDLDGSLPEGRAQPVVGVDGCQGEWRPDGHSTSPARGGREARGQMIRPRFPGVD
jgi:hypothetical protein